ncbi:O-antigen polysaccharide polymerase Wzy [Cupriavidus basilensis]
MVLNAVFSGLGVLVKLLSGLATNKILSVQLGPAAFGIWGNIFSITSLYSTFSNGGIGQGLVAKLSAEGQAGQSRDRWLAGGLVYAVGLPFLICGFHVVFRNLHIVNGAELLNPAAALMIALFAGLSLHIQAVALSLGKARLNSLVVGLSGPLALLAYWLMVRPASPESAILALVAGGATTLATWLFAAKQANMRWHAGVRMPKANWAAARTLAPYMVIALAPALVGTTAVLAVRETISAQLGPEAAGLWQGLFRISDAVIAMTQAVVAYVLLPEVFRSGSPREALKARLPGYAMMVAAGFAAGLLILLLASDLIVRLLYSEQFMLISKLLWIEFLGDALKALAMPFVAFFIYERKLRFSWALELVFSISFVLGSHFLISITGLAGAAIAYVVANLILLIVASTIFLVHGMRSIALPAIAVLILANLISGSIGTLSVQAPITGLTFAVCLALTSFASSTRINPASLLCLTTGMFLLGRFLITYILGWADYRYGDWFLMGPMDITLVAKALAAISLFLCGITLAVGKLGQMEARDDPVLARIALRVGIVLMPFALYRVHINLATWSSGDYLGIYKTGGPGGIPYAIGSWMILCIFAFIASRPKWRLALLAYVLGVTLCLLDTLKGARGIPMAQIIGLTWLFVTSQGFRFSVWKALVAGVALAIFGEYLGRARVGVEGAGFFSANLLDTLMGFVYGQGVSLIFIVSTLKNISAFVLPIDGLRSTFALFIDGYGRLFQHLPTGQNLEFAHHTASLAHRVSFIVDAEMYLAGKGMGAPPLRRPSFTPR